MKTETTPTTKDTSNVNNSSSTTARKRIIRRIPDDSVTGDRSTVRSTQAGDNQQQTGPSTSGKQIGGTEPDSSFFARAVSRVKGESQSDRGSDRGESDTIRDTHSSDSGSTTNSRSKRTRTRETTKQEQKNRDSQNVPRRVAPATQPDNFAFDIFEAIIEGVLRALFDIPYFAGAGEWWRLTDDEAHGLASSLITAIKTLPVVQQTKWLEMFNRYMPWLTVMMTGYSITAPKVKATNDYLKARKQQTAGFTGTHRDSRETETVSDKSGTDSGTSESRNTNVYTAPFADHFQKD